MADSVKSRLDRLERGTDPRCPACGYSPADRITFEPIDLDAAPSAETPATPRQCFTCQRIAPLFHPITFDGGKVATDV